MTEQEKIKQYERWFEFIYPIYKYFLKGKPEPFYYLGDEADKILKEMEQWEKQRK